MAGGASTTSSLKNKAKSNRHHKHKMNGKYLKQRDRTLLSKIRRYSRSCGRDYLKDHEIVVIGKPRRLQEQENARRLARCAS